jgi:signal transduction histidine kinase
VAKHSAATRCEVRCRREGADLVVEVWDDGRGGASIGPVGGLAGLEGRVEGVDGSFGVSSPAGGPTLVTATIPVPAWQTSTAPAPAPVTPPGT